MRRIRFGAIAATVLAMSSLSATAEEFNLGQHEYMNSCASCHGADGRGQGPLAAFLTDSLPDLTTLQRENGGVFPFARLYEVVDGRVDIGAHGTRQMPAWGLRYDRAAPGHLGEMWMPGDRETFVRARILALVEYISTLQED